VEDVSPGTGTTMLAAIKTGRSAEAEAREEPDEMIPDETGSISVGQDLTWLCGACIIRGLQQGVKQ